MRGGCMIAGDDRLSDDKAGNDGVSGLRDERL